MLGWASLASAQSDTIRARLLTAGGTPSPSATMLATPVGGTATVQASADDAGRIMAVVPHGTTPVLLVLRAPGLEEQRRTVQRDHSFVDVGDVTLVPAPVAQLATVKVVERRRQRPPRTDGSSSDPAASQAGSPLVTGLSGDVMGDLALLAGTIPGISVTRDQPGAVTGFSALGLSPDQNATTIQGVRTSAGNLPRDAAVNTRIAVTTFDPSRGGFSGAQTSVQVLPGSRYSARSLRFTIDAPALQAVDPIARRLGQTPTDVQTSGLVSGPLHEGRVLYNASGQLGIVRLTSPAFAPERLRSAVDIGADAARIEAALATAEGYGLGAAGTPTGTDGNASGLVRLDLAPGRPLTGNVIASGRWRETTHGYASPLTALGSSATQRSEGADVVTTVSRYIKGVVLNEAHVGMTWAASSLVPTMALPEVQVATLAQSTDSGQGIAPLTFGGRSGIASRFDSRALELNNETSWSSLDARHHGRVTVSGRAEHATARRLTDPGFLAYENEQDFAANRPSSFSRLLGEEERALTLGTLALSAADVWTPSPRLRLQYGLRMDGVALPALASPDPTLASALAIEGIVARGITDLSPRASATWAYGSRSRLLGMGAEPLGSVRVGLGVFQDVPSAGDLVTVASSRDGPFATEHCIGVATPVPDWNALQRGDASSIGCPNDGALAQTAPYVEFLAPSSRFPRSARASAGWEGMLGRGWRADAELVASSTTRLARLDDVNFGGVVTQVLDDGRPLYAAATSIDSASGRIVSTASRLDPRWGRVTRGASDLAARSTQLTVRLAPEAALGPFDVTLAYTLGSFRSQGNGFRGTTAGDPRTVEWGRAPTDRRHEVNLIGSAVFRGGMTASLWARIGSGLPYTPVVNRDVNGDGLANDRAAVPAAGGDTSRAAALDALRTSAPSRVRECLDRNAGGIAGRASCEGPWAAQLNAQLRVRAPAFAHTQRLTAVLTFVNVPALLDYVLHGASPLGWGQGGTVDPVLWQVTDYSAANQRFGLRANPGFGRLLSARDGLRAPFQLTLDVRFALGPPRVEQLYRQSIAKPRTDTAALVVILRDQLAGEFPNTPQEILRIEDSLQLSPAQVTRLRALQRRYSERSDAIWTPVARLLAAADRSQAHHDAGVRDLREAQERAADLLVELAREIRTVVTPEQIRMMHPLFAVLLDEYRVHDLLVRPF